MHAHLPGERRWRAKIFIVTMTMLIINSLFSTSHSNYWCTFFFEHTHVTTSCLRVGAKFSSSQVCGCLSFRRAQ